MTKPKYDVVICGGAIIGSAIAYFLKCHLRFAGTVAVVERDKSYAQCSTALSASGIRQQFSDPLNVQIGLFGRDFIRKAPDNLGVDLSFRENGYLYLANTDENAAILRQNNAVQTQFGADTILLDNDAMAQRFPHLRLNDIVLGSYGISGEGWFDNMGMLSAMRKASQTASVDYINDTVIGLSVSDKVDAVTLKDFGNITCGAFVNAAGPRASMVAEMAGIDIPIYPRKRTNFLFACAKPPQCDLPLMINTDGVWCRPEGEHFLCGCAPTDDPDVGLDDFDPRHAEFEDIIWPSLAERAECFEAIKPMRFWAGHYAYNTLDQNAVVGPHPDVPNFLFANGFSGHGLQQAPAVGRAIAEWITNGQYQSIDFTPLGFERIQNNSPMKERCII